MKRLLLWLMFGKNARFERVLKWWFRRKYGFDLRASDYHRSRPHAADSKLSAVGHALKYGIGDDPRVIEAHLKDSLQKLRGLGENRPKAILVSHDLSATGAPLLALELLTELRKSHDVWVISGGTGALWAWFDQLAARVTVIGPDDPQKIEELPGFEDFKSPDWIFINSIEAIRVLDMPEQLTKRTIALVHEFAQTTAALPKKIKALKRTALVVFSSKVTRNSFVDFDKSLATFSTMVLAQPLISKLPGDAMPSVRMRTNRSRLFEGKGNPRLVLGAGSVNYRKGVDLFIETCRQVEQKSPNRNRYAWMGGSTNGPDDVYLSYLIEQLKLAGLTDSFSFIEHGNFRSALKQADVFLVSSRADPLPNVALDALALEIPTFCFRGTTGLVELLEDFKLGNFAVPFPDCNAASTQILKYLSNPGENKSRRARLARALRGFGAADYLKLVTNAARETQS